MKLWLASYPRSGNTLLRFILSEAFGVRSTSKYPSEDERMSHRPAWYVAQIGYAGPLATVSFDDGWVGVKTHDLPVDDEPAIFIVRDGRAAVVSYYHMLQDFTEMRQSLEEIISEISGPAHGATMRTHGGTARKLCSFDMRS